MRDHATLVSSCDDAGVLPPAIVARIRGEFLEMPGLRLTPTQAARLFGVEYVTACAVLQALAATRFLRRWDDGSYGTQTG